MNIIRAAVFLSAFAGIWFLALFCLLPIGHQQDPDAEPTMTLGSKFLWATGIAVVGLGVFYALIHTGIIDI